MDRDKTPLFKDRRFIKDFDDITFEFELIKKIIDLRQKKNMSQNDLAEKMNTKQSNVSRMENAKSIPSLTILHRVAKALDCELEVTFKPLKKQK
ncbi:MAG: helix-turn-helix domain-containing protein [Candidatus Izemoplasmataceae bacterium]|jgi:transcriptional regulator with XRE-family HTH domain|uniref:helix-turn-helix domain-containing protein n=1 Tax=Liberiplasma polymorphum TaxID=3374570 RepID=UPI003770DE35